MSDLELIVVDNASSDRTPEILVDAWLGKTPGSDVHRLDADAGLADGPELRVGARRGAR